MNRLLFLCTGNYYRSRYSEILFNSLASSHELDWQADSRGLALDLTGGNLGPMAKVAFESLVVKADFQAADLIIALDEEEHRPMMQVRFPDWENRIIYWLVHDLHLWASETALAAIDSQVNQLVKELRDNPRILGKANI
jgi:protein-tyrosine phosphatase